MEIFLNIMDITIEFSRIHQFTGSHGGHFLEHHSCVSRTNTIYSVKTRAKSIFEVRKINANANVIEFHDIAG